MSISTSANDPQHERREGHGQPADSPALVQAAPVATQPARHLDPPMEPSRPGNTLNSPGSFLRSGRTPRRYRRATGENMGKTAELSAGTHGQFQPSAPSLASDEIQVKLRSLALAGGVDIRREDDATISGWK